MKLTKLEVLGIICTLPIVIVFGLLILPVITKDMYWSFTKGTL